MDELSGLERAFFGPVRAADVNAWLAEVLRERLAVDVAEIVFRSGRIDAVYGLRLADGPPGRRPMNFSRCAADALVIGHGDWNDGNARFEDEEVVAVFDWDLMAETEAVLAGLTATAYLAAGAPSLSEATAFLGDVEDARGAAFSATQRRAASAAGRWVPAFNARCELSNLGNREEIDDDEIPDTSPLGRLLRSRDPYEFLW